MNDWCPLTGPIPAAWPVELREIIIEARRILGAKATRGLKIEPERVAELRNWFAAAPAWLDCLLDARDAADEAGAVCPDLAWDQSAPEAPDEARSIACLLAIHAARQAALSTDRRAALAFLRAARDTLSEAHAMSALAAAHGSSKGARKAAAARASSEAVEDLQRETQAKHAIVLEEARALLAARPRPLRGLATDLQEPLKKRGVSYTNQMINIILKKL